jgi:preprotein translocase subunit YajC
MLVGVAIMAAATAMMFLMIWEKKRKRQAAREHVRFAEWQ